MIWLQFAIIVTIGALIGWITNKVAIKMMFRPVNPVKVLFFTLQGVFPKRKDQMAISLADTIERELLSKEVIMDKILNQENMEKTKQSVMDALVIKIAENIPSVAKMFLGDNVEGMIRSYLDKEGDRIFDEMIDTFKDEALENLNIRVIVKERIDSLDFIEFEKIIFGLMNRELKHEERIGLILGALIGVVQFFVTQII